MIHSQLESDKSRFLEAMLEQKVLQFGQFTTKSGRESPYFFNMGLFNDAKSMGVVAQCYAHLILSKWPELNQYHFYGPAYKGIPLAVMIADRVYQISGKQSFFSFNRKELKDHGEGGGIVGKALDGNAQVIIVEDVLTGGTSLRESYDFLQQYGVEVKGIVVGVDREERGLGHTSAKQDIEQLYQIPLTSLLSLSEIREKLNHSEVLGKKWIDDHCARRIEQYQRQFGSL